jgi:hypothetical protein
MVTSRKLHLVILRCEYEQVVKLVEKVLEQDTDVVKRKIEQRLDIGVAEVIESNH